MQCLEYPFDSKFILKMKRKLRRELLSEDCARTKIKVAILGGATTHDIKDVLELFLLNSGICPEFYESEYNRYYEDAVYGTKELDEFCPDIVYFCTCNRNLKTFPTLTATMQEVEDCLQSEYKKYRQMWQAVKERYHCAIIQNNFEFMGYRLMGNREAWDIHGKIYFITRLNLMFAQYAQENSSFYIYDINYASAKYGLEKWLDEGSWNMYKYPVCVPAVPQYAYGLFNIIKSLYGKNKKALMLDLDNTLWGGVVGDDGADNLEIGQETAVGQAYSAFQSYVREHGQLGIVLAVNSKNEENVAISGFERPDSVLKKTDFAVFKANWNPKSENLLEAASELSLLPESFVFVDDNPAERENVRQGVSGVAIPELETVETYIQSIDGGGYFEVTNLSEDDLKRNEMYAGNVRRMQEQKKYANYRDYLLSLEMTAEITPFLPVYYGRIAQLTNKSNQFNLTTLRLSRQEIEELAQSEQYVTLCGTLADKFGENGVVSLVIGEQQGKILHIRLWLMSCRVLKRDMELAMMDALVKRCKAGGIQTIRGYYYPTNKNGMVREFYSELGFEKVETKEDESTLWNYEIPHDYREKNTVIHVEEEGETE